MITDLVRRVTFGRAKIKKFPDFTSGDTLNVHVKVKEGEKERVQVFKGVVIKVQGSGIGRSFTVRKISSGVGVERTFPFACPSLDKIEVVSIGHVRRSRLFYLRKLKGRAARLDTTMVSMGDEINQVGAADEIVDASVTEASASAPKEDKK